MTKTFLYIGLLSLILSACGGSTPVKPAPPATKPTNNPIPSNTTPTVQTPSNPSINQTPPTGTDGKSTGSKAGGYYLDDGPGDNPPANIDGIPGAVPKKEAYLTRANKPYKALGATYRPMTSWQPYKARGIATWYGKRFHGRKTSSGEVYDMYAMTAAHTILPLPSYAKVTNPANGRSVIVRVNDRGPFKHNRIIDLSYAAAHQLRYTSAGSAMVEVEAIDPDNYQAANAGNTGTANNGAGNTISTNTISTNNSTAANSQSAAVSAQTNASTTISQPVNSEASATAEYFVQAGAFKNAVNAQALSQKIQSLEIAPNAGINSVYNNGLHRLKLGPFVNKAEADAVAAAIRKQLNSPAIIVNQP